ncbi:MAG: glycine cleavage system aminomethyltransferase GcvT [Leptonema sp. (in: Bacteria)]|nr:glycine cleavage system aminomethyltransferase GcvT [Leptonema sp. (in: bacteria)]
MQRTPLYDTHISHGGRMVVYAGYDMPVQYSSIIEEHKKVRSACGLFDVSHMGEIRVFGPNSLTFLESLTPNLVEGQSIGQIRYNAILNEQGGVKDDITIFKEKNDSYFLIVNASNTEKIWSYLNEKKIENLTLENRSRDYSLLALQGPLAESILKLHFDFDSKQIESLPYFHFIDIKDMRVSRTGYTGEDGFEILCSNERVISLWKELIEIGGENILPAGLGARDSLRLEAMYPLYGHELTEDRTPVESGLGWIVKQKQTPYFQMEKILDQKKNGTERRICGFIVQESGIARDGMEVIIDGKVEGSVQSGAFSPILGKSIGTAFLPSKLIQDQLDVKIKIRDKQVSAKLQTKAFYKRVN